MQQRNPMMMQQNNMMAQNVWDACHVPCDRGMCVDICVHMCATCMHIRLTNMDVNVRALVCACVCVRSPARECMRACVQNMMANQVMPGQANMMQPGMMQPNLATGMAPLMMQAQGGRRSSADDPFKGLSRQNSGAEAPATPSKDSGGSHFGFINQSEQKDPFDFVSMNK